MKIKKALSIISAGVMALASMSVTTVLAKNEYTAITGGSVVFDKYLIVEGETNAPKLDFEFQATGINGDIVGDEGYVTVFDGSALGTPTITKASFTPASDTYSTVQARDTSIDASRGIFVDANFQQDAVTLPSGKDYAKATATIDFSGITFTSPGVYRWEISEVVDASAEAMGVEYTDESRFVDVYVDQKTFNEATGTGTLEIKGYVFHSDGTFRAAADDDHKPAETSDYVKSKAKGFTNTYETKTVTVKSTASGNQADHTKYFEYEITVEDAGDETTLVIGGDKYDEGTLDTGEENPVSVTTNPDGTKTFKVYLQPGQEAEIKGLPLTSKMTISENSEEYDEDIVDENGNSVIIRDENGNPTGVTSPADKYIELVNKLDDEGNPILDDHGQPIKKPVKVIDLTKTDPDSPDYDPDYDIDKANSYTFKLSKEGTLPTGVLMSVLPGVIVAVAAVGLGVFIWKKKKNEEDEEDDESSEE